MFGIYILHIHWSATMFKPLTVEVNTIDHLITMQCSVGKPWAWRMWQRVQGINLASRFPRSRSNDAFMALVGTSPQNPQDSKYLTPTSWQQTPQETLQRSCVHTSTGQSHVQSLDWAWLPSEHPTDARLDWNLVNLETLSSLSRSLVHSWAILCDVALAYCPAGESLPLKSAVAMTGCHDL